MDPLVIASHNPHKVYEFSLISPGIPFVGPEKFGITKEESFEETGATFFENAYGKAKHTAEHIYNKTGRWIAVLADDSGICVPALGGAPGLYSARYGSELENPPKNDKERTSLLLERMKGIVDRRGYYVCSLVCYLGPDRFWSSQEIWEGVVAEIPSEGTTGFGYDPIMRIPPSFIAVADMNVNEKAMHSHRAKAYFVLQPTIKKLFTEGAFDR